MAMNTQPGIQKAGLLVAKPMAMNAAPVANMMGFP